MAIRDNDVMFIFEPYQTNHLSTATPTCFSTDGKVDEECEGKKADRPSFEITLAMLKLRTPARVLHRRQEPKTRSRCFCTRAQVTEAAHRLSCSDAGSFTCILLSCKHRSSTHLLTSHARLARRRFGKDRGKAGCIVQTLCMPLTLTQRLKSALWYSVGQIVDAVSLEQDLNATPQFIGALTEMVWTQIRACSTGCHVATLLITPQRKRRARH